MDNVVDHPFTVIPRQDDGHFVALCAELNVASQGESPAEARRNINEAIAEYLDHIREICAEDEIESVPFDMLQDFLTERG